MDLMTLAVLLLTIMISLVVGYFAMKLIFPNFHYEIEIAKAFDAGDFDLIIQKTENLLFKQHSLNVYLYAARARVHRKMYVEALQWFEVAIPKISPTNDSDKIFIEIEIADIYVHLNQDDKAEMHYRTALSLKKNHPIASYKLGLLLFRKEQYDRCRLLIRAILKENPLLADARRLYAECLVMLGLYHKAIRQYGTLARAGEKIVSYNYAKTLKALKIWERAYETFLLLIEENIEPKYFERMVCELIEVTIILKRFHQGLGLIEKYISQVKNPLTILELRYLRANLFDQRGDKMLALKEFQILYLEKPMFKDLSSIIKKAEQWLVYPFLFSYFTSNETLFEQVVMNISLPGSVIRRKTLEYYLVQFEDTMHIFFRDIMPISSRLNFDIGVIATQLYPELNFLHLWSLNGISGTYSLSGFEYRFQLRSGDDFLTNVKDAVAQLSHGDHISYSSPEFINGVPDALEVVPVSDEDVSKLLKDNYLDDAVDKDDILSKAFD